jgi:hypothetical protein
MLIAVQQNYYPVAPQKQSTTQQQPHAIFVVVFFPPVVGSIWQRKGARGFVLILSFVV